MEKETNIPKEVLKELVPHTTDKLDTDQLDTIAYTLWGVIHKLPIEVVIGLVVKECLTEGLGEIQFDSEQEYKEFLHDTWFFRECDDQGLCDELGEEYLF